jgi:hypothetical protein
MGQTLTEIAETLRDADKKVQLIYAFNASGKTRLSREFKELIDPKNDDRDDDDRSKVLYYNAFTEDLFYWDNDLDSDTERKLRIQPNAFTKSVFEDLGLDLNVITAFQRYTQPNLTPRFNQEYKTTDKDGKEITIPAFSEVTFTLGQDPETNPERLKISKGEESNFIWSVFYCLLDQVISARNVTEVEERETDQFNDLDYIFIDDPVSSLDENHLIQLAVDVADLVKKSLYVDGVGLKFVITTHNPLFFNVLHNELSSDDRYLSYKGKTYSKYRLEKKGDGTFELSPQPNDSPFSYHLYLLRELQAASETGEIRRYHFNFIRNILEKSSTFLGHNRWSDLLPKTTDGRPNPYQSRILNISSHSKQSSEEVQYITDENKRVFRYLVRNIAKNFQTWQWEGEDG